MENILKFLKFDKYLLGSTLFLILVSILFQWWINRNYETKNSEEKNMIGRVVDYGFRILIILVLAIKIRNRAFAMGIFTAGVLVIGIYNYTKNKKIGKNFTTIMSSVYLFLGIFGNIIINLFHNVINY